MTNRAAIPNPALEPLAALIGDWHTTGKHPAVPEKTVHGKASFEWIEGGAFLVMHSQLDDERFPDGIAIVGSDDAHRAFFMLYFDQRGVSRKYDFAFGDQTWSWWRQAKDCPSASHARSRTVAEQWWDAGDVQGGRALGKGPGSHLSASPSTLAQLIAQQSDRLTALAAAAVRPWIAPCSCHLVGKENHMLSDNDAIATVAVKNLESAKQFYEGTLGLTKVMENEEVLAFKTGASTLFVYRSQYAGTNKATAVTFVAEEVDDLVRTLKSRGVTFEHYDLPKMTRQGDVHVAGQMRTAWFKDPDGNIFSLVTPPNTAARETASASAQSTAERPLRK